MEMGAVAEQSLERKEVNQVAEREQAVGLVVEGQAEGGLGGVGPEVVGMAEAATVAVVMVTQ